MRKKVIHAAVTFLIIMMIFTVLSRAADSVNVIQIQIKSPANQMVTHVVKGNGKVEGSKELAVFVQENLQIEQVLVQTGQEVKKGEPLLTLTGESIQGAIKGLENKEKTLENQIKDLECQEKVNRQKRASDQVWAGNSYGLAVQSGNVSVDNARAEVQAAQEKLDEFYRQKEEKNELAGFTGGDAPQEGFQDRESLGENFAENSGEASQGNESDSSQEEQALQDSLRASQEALNEAIAGRNQTLASAGKTVADANLPQASDSTLENTRRELETVQEDKEKLTNLQMAEGKVSAPADGVVKSLSVQTGDLTGVTAVAVLYSSDGTLRMKGSISSEDMKYVEEGKEVQMTDYNNNDISGATVESVTENEQDSNSRDLSVLIPQESAAIGQNVEFSISKDAGPYDCCVPLSAVYEENGKNYVYTTDTENTVLGSVMVVRKTEVTVKDKNQTVAALDGGSISSGQQVVIWSDRELKDGSRVRLQEN